MPTKPSSEAPTPATGVPLEAVAAELERLQLRIRLHETAEGDRIGVSPAGAVTPELRAGLAQHRATVAPLLRLWGDAAGSLLLRTLYHPAPLPASPFPIKGGRIVEDGEAWLSDLRRRALEGPASDAAAADAFTRDLAALILLP